MKLCALQSFDGAAAYTFAGYAVRLVRLIVLSEVFASLLRHGAGTEGMTSAQAIAYVVLSSAFSEQLFLFTPATTALWEGSIITRFTRPMSLVGDMAAETAGRWFPSLVFFTIPVLILVPLFMQISIAPVRLLNGLLSITSFLLSVSLGFAVDFLFAAFAIHLKNGCWAALMIREATTELLSGALIPLSFLPAHIGDILALLPFGSLASAPLSVYLGIGGMIKPLAAQVFWNLVLWPVSLVILQKSRERMISYGG